MNSLSELDPQKTAESLVGGWLSLPEVAEALEIPVTRVHRLLEAGSLVEIRHSDSRVRMIPAEFFADGEIIQHLPGTITLLKDQGLESAEIISWLFTEDDSLPGRPIDQLRAGQRGEVRRRAQSLGF